MPYLHLPIQAGSDRILKEMNRSHRAEDYLKLIARIRQARPDIALSGDFIVGFPGESEADFEDTLAVVRGARYASAFSFKYSPRPGTPAAEMAKQVPDEIKSDRLARLQALLGTQQQAFNQACLSRKMPILLEKLGRHPGQLVGRSPYLQSVYIDGGTHAIGDMVNVTIDAVGSNSLSAHIQA
jgi:tRNA-2-methylthio-N6-dimethylallyladenosine synthase